MPHVSLRVTEYERDLMESYSKLHGISRSGAIKEAFFEKLENEYGIKAVNEHETEKSKGNVKHHSHAEVKEMLGLS